jgi:hypothetical protein
MFKEFLTVGNDPKEGTTLKSVIEPIYAPFNGFTLILSPLDSFETLGEFVKSPLPLYTEGGGMPAAPITQQGPQPGGLFGPLFGPNPNPPPPR